MSLYAKIDEADFRRLVAGKEVVLMTAKGETIRLILADIGWGRIRLAIVDAMSGKSP